VKEEVCENRKKTCMVLGEKVQERGSFGRAKVI
jgi:hypothetical protein